MDEAGALLGHHYFIDGLVVHGKARGRELGFPTANLQTANELLPPAGVYATTAAINGVEHPSVTNVGMRPTFGDVDRIVVETHLLDLSRDLYDARRTPVVRPAPQGRTHVPRRGRAARPDRRGLPIGPPAVRAHFAVSKAGIRHSGISGRASARPDRID